MANKSQANWKNPAVQPSMNKQDVRRLIRTEKFMQTFEPGIYQIMKRVSDAPQGLRYGSAPGVVSR